DSLNNSGQCIFRVFHKWIGIIPDVPRENGSNLTLDERVWILREKYLFQPTVIPCIDKCSKRIDTFLKHSGIVVLPIDRFPTKLPDCQLCCLLARNNRKHDA